MKNLFLIFLSSIATAQSALNAQIRMKSETKPTLYQITAANSANIKYVKDGTEASLSTRNVEAYHLTDPRKYTVAYNHMLSGDYETALDQFKTVTKDYSSFALLDNNPANKAAYYAHFCAIQLGQYDQLGELESLVNKKTLIGGEFLKKGETLDVWENVANNDLDRILAKLKSVRLEKYPNEVAAELAYLKSLGNLHESNKEEAIDNLHQSIALASTNFKSFERLAIVKLLELLNEGDAISEKDAKLFKGLGTHYQTFYAHKIELPLPILARLRDLGLDV